MELLAGAGHPSNLERPDEVNARLREFLSEVYEVAPAADD
jgi:pimeloyl-ACP methyl ester carboxylesterase